MAVTHTLTDATAAQQSSTTHTFLDLSIGSAADDRLVLVLVMHLNDGSGVSGVSVGEVSAARVVMVNEETPAQSSLAVECWLAAVPSGTTADVEIAGLTVNQIVIATVHRVAGADMSDPVADSDSGYAASSSAAITLDVPADGALVAGCLTGVATSEIFSHAWTGASEDLDGNINFDGTVFAASSASRETDSQLLSESVSVVRSGTPAAEFGVALVGVAIRPAAEDAGFSDIFYGEDQINAIKHGEDDIARVYRGSDLIFESS